MQIILSSLSISLLLSVSLFSPLVFGNPEAKLQERAERKTLPASRVVAWENAAQRMGSAALTGSDYCGSGCQSSYGQCKVVTTPSCAVSSGTTKARAIGYWQSVNLQRACDTVTPQQINTTGLTHLVYAFVQFDSTYTIVAPDPSSTYSAFTALKSSAHVQPWIAIGGVDSSGNSPPWTQMTASSSTRSTFITSLKAFMTKYGFTGVDLDWEFPGFGNGDTANFVSLVQELRKSLGTSYGISATLPASNTQIMSFDAKGMQASVDWFSFMAYDMNFGRGAIHGHTDITDMSFNAPPLWYDGLNMSKVNFGMAYYGRGWTPKQSGCLSEGCTADPVVQNGPCTQSGGESVMSLTEIKRLAQTSNPQLVPHGNQTTMYEVITFNNQWMGYDNEQSFAWKRDWANGKCFGGTFIWSVDFYNHGKVY